MRVLKIFEESTGFRRIVTQASLFGSGEDIFRVPSFAEAHTAVLHARAIMPAVLPFHISIYPRLPTPVIYTKATKHPP